jgi:LysR family transcriptional regulator, low CO2-responsive transcriptional regulator
MIHLNHLRVFYHAAKCLNFSLAAKNLSITQPAVSVQIKLFEDSCNLKLFKRRGKQVYLTDEGQALYEYARTIFEYEKEIEDAIEEMRKLKRGILRLGTSKAYARYFMPFLIAGFRDAYPHIKIHLDEGSALDMVNSLLDLRNEIAIIAKVEDNPEIRFIPFSREEVVLIVAPENPLAKKTCITLSELAGEAIILKERGSGTRKLINDLFHDNGITLEILMETSNEEFIKQLVQRGDGVSFIVREVVAAELKEKKLTAVAIKDHPIFLEVSIAYLENQHLSPPAQAFLAMLLDITKKEKPGQGIKHIMNDMLSQWK